MDLLPLNDPRWAELGHRTWAPDRRSASERHATYVPRELAQLLNNPDDIERFEELGSSVCSEGTAWPAACAVVPYAVELAGRVAPERRFEYLYFVGLVEICSYTEEGEEPEMPTYLIGGYRTAKARALRLLAETITCHHDAIETRYLLAAVAALKGHSVLGETLNHLDCVSGSCPRCGEEVYPEELQRLA